MSLRCGEMLLRPSSLNGERLDGVALERVVSAVGAVAAASLRFERENHFLILDDAVVLHAVWGGVSGSNPLRLTIAGVGVLLGEARLTAVRATGVASTWNDGRTPYS